MDDEVTYIISIVNNLDDEITNVKVVDNLGTYDFEGKDLVPLSYINDSLKYYVNGILGDNDDITITPTDDELTIEQLTIPANGDAVIVYQVRTNEYAPMEQDEYIDNTVEITGEGIRETIEASERINVENSTNLSMIKSMSPTVVNPGDTLTYTFAITNSGNTDADTDVVISDTFAPKLGNIVVEYNDTVWTKGTEYEYDEETGEFVTTEGFITIPAAKFEQDEATGVISTVPGIVVITVSGKVLK